jgi:hypothetical protein
MPPARLCKVTGTHHSLVNTERQSVSQPASQPFRASSQLDGEVEEQAAGRRRPLRGKSRCQSEVVVDGKSMHGRVGRGWVKPAAESENPCREGERHGAPAGSGAPAACLFGQQEEDGLWEWAFRQAD